LTNGPAETHNGGIMRILGAFLIVAAIGIAHPPGTRVLQLSPVAALPAGRKIVFVRTVHPGGRVFDAPTPTNLFVASADGHVAEIQLTTDNYSEDPIWSPDASKIAFVHLQKWDGRESFTSTFAIMVVRADGSNSNRLASIQSVSLPSLAWSPDGKNLAACIATVPPGAELDGRGHLLGTSIFLLDPDIDGTPRLLVKNGCFPSWSPDSSQIAYSCPTELKLEVYRFAVCVVSIAGDLEPRTVVENAGRPAWSPDGENIAYSTGPFGKEQVAIIHPDGSNKTLITDGKHRAESFAWSPDGKQIAFTETRPMEPAIVEAGHVPHSVEVARIFVRQSDGTRTGPYGERDRLWCRDLSWSSDSKFLAAVCTSGVTDNTSRARIGESSLFMLDSANLKAPPRIVARNGVERPIFSPR
jgi:Tol biopolymer transport system component